MSVFIKFQTMIERLPISKLNVYKLIGVASIAISINIFNLLELFVFPTPTHINNKGALKGNIDISLIIP
jgi:hypothetical protein